MQLTRAADYAVRVMVHLAAVAPGTRASRTELAGAVDCPEQFLSKVLQSLTRAGLVTSHRGNTGGFELPAVPPFLIRAGNCGGGGRAHPAEHLPEFAR